MFQNKKLKDKSKKQKQATAQQIKQEQINHLRNVHHIHVNGDDVPEPVESFEKLLSEYKDIPETLYNNLRQYDFSEPTPIQMQAIPVMLHVINISYFRIKSYLKIFF